MEVTAFCELFTDVLQRHLLEFDVVDTDVRNAVREIYRAYSKQGQKLNKCKDPVDFDNPASRCAYLYKYAGFHAAMVHHVLSSYLKHTNFLKSIPLGKNDTMNICCLGGGPGNDICGLSNTLSHELEVKRFRLTTIDIMEGWASAMDTVLELAQSPKHNNFNIFFSRIVSNEYLRDDLLSPGAETKKALRSADLITMIKFVSTVKRHRITGMLKVIFRELKPGAMVLFIDNAGGGFQKMVSQVASECCLRQLCVALRHVWFRDDVFKHRSYGTCRVSATTVTAQIWIMNSPSSVSPRITNNIEGGCPSPSSTEVTSLSTSARELALNKSSFVAVNGNQTTIATTEQKSLVESVVEERSCKLDDSCKMEETSLAKNFPMVNSTEIQQTLGINSDVSMGREKFLDDSVLNKNAEHDLLERKVNGYFDLEDIQGNMVICQNGVRSQTKTNDETDYKTISIFVLVLSVFLILWSYLFYKNL